MNFVILGAANRRQLADLKIKLSEQNLIASNPIWITEAAFEPEAITFGLYDGDMPVGMLSVIDPRARGEDSKAFTQEDCLYVWRIMVDSAHRGRGAGRAALEFAERYAALIGLQGVSLTTADQKPRNALGFYEHLGFSPTGRRVKDEIEPVKRRALS